MIRTICVLAPGTKANGDKCLRGTLSRDFTSTDHHGTQRHYPRGTPIMLVKNPSGGSYSLLAQLPDETPEDFRAEVAECQQFEPSPF